MPPLRSETAARGKYSVSSGYGSAHPEGATTVCAAARELVRAARVGSSMPLRAWASIRRPKPGQRAIQSLERLRASAGPKAERLTAGFAPCRGAMSKVEAAKYILKLWTDDRLGPDDFHAADVMLRLIFLGCPVSRADVLLVARAYCDSQSENRSIGKKLKRL